MCPRRCRCWCCYRTRRQRRGRRSRRSKSSRNGAWAEGRLVPVCAQSVFRIRHRSKIGRTVRIRTICTIFRRCRGRFRQPTVNARKSGESVGSERFVRFLVVEAQVATTSRTATSGGANVRTGISVAPTPRDTWRRNGETSWKPCGYFFPKRPGVMIGPHGVER